MPVPASPPAADPALDDRVVRFDDACVLIPPPGPRSRLPRLLSRAYSLPPLFRRREPSLEPEPALIPPVDRSPPPIALSSSFMSSLPRLSKKSPSPHSPDSHRPLSPCLVHRDPSSPRAPKRRPSLPLPTEPHSPHGPHAHACVGSDLPTVPLRPCCTDCFTVTEACIMQGELWAEKFSRGARRLRSASVDNPGSPRPRPGLRSHASLQERLPSFSAVVVDEVGEVKGSSEPVADDKEGLQEHSAEAVLDLEGSWAIYEPEDKFLSPTISRRGPKLSPIPSTNPSTDDLVHQTSPSTLSAPAPLYPTSPTQARTPSLARKSLETLPPSPFPRTPSPEYSSPPTSPKSRLHVPSGTEIMRLGAGVIKGMAQFGGI